MINKGRWKFKSHALHEHQLGSYMHCNEVKTCWGWFTCLHCGMKVTYEDMSLDEAVIQHLYTKHFYRFFELLLTDVIRAVV